MFQAILEYPRHLVDDLLSQNCGSMFHIIAKHGCSLKVHSCSINSFIEHLERFYNIGV